jgi:O-antigen ligase
MRMGLDGQMPDALSMREERRWSRLAFWGGLYYLIVYAVASNSVYNRQIVWGGAALLGIIMTPLLAPHMRLSSLPREGLLLGLFLLWATTGFFVATEKQMLVRYLQLLSELTVIVIGISLILKYSGSVKWFHYAFLLAAVLAVFLLGQPIAMESLTPADPLRSELESANALGFSSALGVFGALAVLPEIRRFWARMAIIAGGLLAVYAVLLSASRTAFLALIIIAILWPTLCLASTGRFKLTALAGAVFMLFLLYLAYQFILQETYMGARFIRATEMEDNSTRVRLNLIRIGLQIFANNPIVGCGLGEFGVASGTGFYAHNEFVEIAATTGLPGLVLYYSMYAVAWRRLSRSLRKLQDPLARYRANVARVALLVLVVTGLVSTPNFLSKPSMFLLATAVGIAHWAERMARQGGLVGADPRRLQPEPAGLSPAGWPSPAGPLGWGITWPAENRG